jgi:hypothetical protein
VKALVGLFAISALFGLAMATTYWFVAQREAAGTALLGIMTAALAFTAGYAVVAERDANLEGDRPDETMADTEGEDLGIFTTASAWPILIAVCALAMLVGLLWAPLVSVVALIGLVVCFWRLGGESARV